MVCKELRWNYIFRILLITQEEVRPLREAIRSRLLPASMSREGFAEDELLLLELPARLGDLGILDVDSVVERELETSRRVTDSQVRSPVAQPICCGGDRSLHFPCW